MLDETTEQGDKGSTGSSSETSTAAKVTSSIEEGKQYDGAAVKKLVEDALSEDGRAQKTRAEAAEAENKLLKEQGTALTGQVSTLNTQMTELVKAQNEAEVAKVGEDPAAIASVRARQANAAETIRLATQKATQDAKEATIKARETESANQEISTNIKLAALAAGVDADKLKEIVPDGDKGRLVTAAALLKGQTEIDPITGKPKPAALTQRPASALSAGGFDAMTADDKITRGLEQKKNK